MGMKGKPAKHLCGVPKEKCNGSFVHTNHGLIAGSEGLKSHSSPGAAFNCMKRYLLKQGYTQVGSKEFSPPDGGPVRVLTKKSRYGGALRSGKEGTRHEPYHKRSGVIIG